MNFAINELDLREQNEQPADPEEYREALREALLPFDLEQIEFIGSRAVLGQGEDTDYLLLVSDQRLFGYSLTHLGWSLAYSAGYASPFYSARKGGVNLIFTDDPEFYIEKRAAHRISVYLHQQGFDLSNKQTRIDVHEAAHGNRPA